MEIISVPAADLYAFFKTPAAAGAVCPMLVNGTSMQPTLHHLRDTVWLTALNRPARRGDIVLFRRKNGQVVLHRVLHAQKGILEMNGDGQMFTENVPECCAAALVRRFQRSGKMIDCRAPLYRTYSRLWCAVRPVRPQIFRFCSMWRRLSERESSCGKKSKS
ncbi:MAG: S24/S26 family peptidase [Oscillospiraceae bacterium]|nr:S24/S26 family peptidase [Oscillospiraceae bacterium]